MLMKVQARAVLFVFAVSSFFPWRITTLNEQKQEGQVMHVSKNNRLEFKGLRLFGVLVAQQKTA